MLIQMQYLAVNQEAILVAKSSCDNQILFHYVIKRLLSDANPVPESRCYNHTLIQQLTGCYIQRLILLLAQMQPQVLHSAANLAPKSMFENQLLISTLIMLILMLIHFGASG